MDEGSAKIALQEFIHDSIPEYIADSARELVSDGGVQRLTLDKDAACWEVEGSIQGEDFQIYSPRLSLALDEGLVSYHCNCPDSFSGACRHVAAIALKLLSGLEARPEEDEVAGRPRNEWRQTFRPFFTTAVEPESGRHYLIFHLFPEPTRLQVAFFRARQNKSGLSTVHSEISLEQILSSPDMCDLSPDLPHVASLIGRHGDYLGHRVTIPDGLLSWFFWAIRDEYYIFWRDTDSACRIERRAMELKLRPSFQEDRGLSFDVLLCREGKPPLSIAGAETTFHGQEPLWICWNQSFFPVYSSLGPSLARELTAAPLLVPHEEISEFLDRVWTRLPSSALYGQEEFLQRMEPYFVPAKYNPKLFLEEEGSLLTLEIQNVYETPHGEFNMPGPNPEFQTGSYTYEGKTYLVRRQQEEEAALTAMLLEIRFQPRNARIWFLELEEAITFLLDAYPKLVERYRVYGESSLTRYKVRLSQPVILSQVVFDEKKKWFTLDIDIQYEGQNVPLEKIWKAWTQGRRYVQLKDGSYSSLPEAWLERLAHKLQALGIDPGKPPKQQFAPFEAPVLDNILDDLPDTVTDSFWNTLREKIHSFKEITPVPPPRGLKATLRGYQKQGLAYLNFLREYRFGGILADEMGLG
jgi:non-specific serine/threonine protein kinase